MVDGADHPRRLADGGGSAFDAQTQVEANIKDERTERLRQLLSALDCAEETYDAAAGLTTLSFASRKHPERHVW